MEEERKQEDKRKMGRVKKTFLGLAIVAATLFVGYWGIVSIVWCAQMRDDRRLVGHWQMIDESWEAEVKFRQKRDWYMPCYYSDIYFKSPRFPRFWATMSAFDKTAPEEIVSEDFTVSGTGNERILSCSALAGTYLDVNCEWLDDDVIVLKDEDGRARVYRRK